MYQNCFIKTAILTIFLCFSASFASGQKSSDPAYKIHTRSGGVTITFKGKAHRLNISAQTDAAKVTETELLFAAEKDGFRYLVIDVSGWSREKQNDRQCGAGIESNLIWLKLDAAWKILDAKSVRYESCWAPIELNDAFKRTKNTLFVEFENFRDRLNTKLTYNADEPEKGFQIVETKLAEN